MNALDRIFMNAGKTTTAARFLGVAGAAALVSGCLGDPIASAKVDPRSPIAAEVASVAKTHRTYPKFSDIPPVPDDVRPARIYGERYPLDEDFLAALALMPPASGVALGLDRLVMLATGANHIDQVQWTPVAGVET